jgi:LysW-gamma-L-lysine carboxypeptidase
MSADFSTLIGLIELYSPSGQEHGAVEWLVARMQSLGFGEAFIDEAGNAVGVMGSGPKQVVLLGHIDTVPGEIKVELDNISLYGRGSVDAKGSLACFVDAVAQVGVVDGWQIVVIGAVEEERDSDGARFVVDRYRPDFAIVGEPNNWDRTISREQTHMASGEQTAAEAAVEVWLVVKEYAEAFNVEKQRAFDKILPTLRGLESGQNGFTQWAQLVIGVRLAIEVTPDEWYEKLQETIKVSEIFKVVVERVGYPIPAWECEKITRLVQVFLNGIRQMGGTPRFVYKTGTADLNVVAPVWRCPAVVYGPGDSALDHTPNEHISLDEYGKAVKVLTKALETLTQSKIQVTS